MSKKRQILEKYFLQVLFYQIFQCNFSKEYKEKRKNNIEENFDIWIKEEVREGRVVNYEAN